MPSGHAANTIPVTIITGFLGSGKTTLLNRLLKAPALADTVVIVNEFGAVGLDHLLIEQAIEDAVLLKNGCVCCTVSGDIADTLQTLWRRRADGTLPPFRRIAIETTGLADPAPVAHALLAGPTHSYACRLDGIVTTVDALHGVGQLARQPEAQRQVAMADRVLLTKTDLVSAAEVARVQERIAALNPVAPVQEAARVDPRSVFDLGPDPDAATARLARWLDPRERAAHAGHRHLPFRHGDEIAAVVLRHDRPVPWSALERWLISVLSLRGDRILRLKGLVRLEGHDRPVVLQGVHHVLHPPMVLARAVPASMPTQLVLITRGLSAAGLRASFAAAMGKEQGSPEAIRPGAVRGA